MTSIIHNGYISLFITNNATSVQCEKRYPFNLTIGEFKAKLELVTGCDHRHVNLQVFNEEDEPVCWLDDNMKCLGDYPIKDKMRVHANDPNLKGGEFENLDDVQPLYEISFEEYAKREDTVLAFKRRMKLGQFKEVDPEEERLKKEAIDKKLKEESDKANSMKIGDRCEVRVPNQPAKRGQVKYIGTTHFKPGYWIGVHYDEPSGKNNGTVDDKFYFSCPDKYGAFIKPQHIAIGDYPELGLDDLDEI